MSEKKEEKRPDSIPENLWPEFKRLRILFIGTFTDYDEAKLNEALENHPCNIRPEDDDNPEKRIIGWKDCPLKMTASYYANRKLELDVTIPMPEIEDLKAILDDE